MEKYIFTKKIDKSLLRDGMTLPVDKHKEICKSVGVCLGRGSWAIIDIYINGIPYPAKLTHVDFSEDQREVIQIRYSAGSDICKKINELYGENTGVKTVEIWANDHRDMIICNPEK